MAATAKVIGLKAASEAIEVMHMTIREWALVNDNPRQRDTEGRAEKALAEYLGEPKVTHQVVHAGRLPSTRLFKLDGHTRSYLWSTARIPDPGKLTVIVYPVTNLDELVDFYGHFDSNKSVENSKDKIQGGFREHELELKSALLKSGLIATSLTMCQRIAKSDVFEKHDMVGAWKEELETLDSIGPKRNKFFAGHLAGALLVIRKEGRAALDFLARYNNGEGLKNGRKMDAVEALAQAKRGDDLNNCGKLLAAYEGFLAGKSYSSPVLGTDPYAYL